MSRQWADIDTAIAALGLAVELAEYGWLIEDIKSEVSSESVRDTIRYALPAPVREGKSPEDKELLERIDRLEVLVDLDTFVEVAVEFLGGDCKPPEVCWYGRILSETCGRGGFALRLDGVLVERRTRRYPHSVLVGTAVREFFDGESADVDEVSTLEDLFFYTDEPCLFDDATFVTHEVVNDGLPCVGSNSELWKVLEIDSVDTRLYDVKSHDEVGVSYEQALAAWEEVVDGWWYGWGYEDFVNSLAVEVEDTEALGVYHYKGKHWVIAYGAVEVNDMYIFIPTRWHEKTAEKLVKRIEAERDWIIEQINERMEQMKEDSDD